MKIRNLTHFFYMAWRQFRWLLGDRSPIAVTIKLTTNCTLSCKHCPWLINKFDDLPTEKWKEIIKEYRKKGAIFLVFEGGEPTLRKDLQELIEFGQSLRMKVFVATNGTRPLGDFFPNFFLISIDGLFETHDRLRGQGTFSKVLKNLPTAKVHKRALISVSRNNADQIEDILEYFLPLVDSFWFSFVYDYNIKNSQVALNSEEKKRIAQKILKLKKIYPIVNSDIYLKNIGTSRECKDWLLHTVTADGVAHSKCMIAALEDCRCNECELACHRELTDYTASKAYLLDLIKY